MTEQSSPTQYSYALILTRDSGVSQLAYHFLLFFSDEFANGIRISAQPLSLINCEASNSLYFSFQSLLQVKNLYFLHLLYLDPLLLRPTTVSRFTTGDASLPYQTDLPLATLLGQNFMVVTS